MSDPPNPKGQHETDVSAAKPIRAESQPAFGTPSLGSATKLTEMSAETDFRKRTFAESKTVAPSQLVFTENRFFQDQIITLGTKVETVRVGISPFHTDFTVHRNLLQRVPYFQTALNGEPQPKGFEEYHTVPAGKADAFTIYVHWLYTRRLHTRKKKQDFATNGHRLEWITLVDSYILGEHLADVEFRDRLMDVLLDWQKEASHADKVAVLCRVSDIYYACPKSSPLRELVSDIAAYSLDDSVIQEMAMKQYPYDFFADTLGKLAGRLQGMRMFKAETNPVDSARGTCRYHCHGKKPCHGVGVEK